MLASLPWPNIRVTLPRLSQLRPSQAQLAQLRRISLPRPTRRGSARALLVLFLIASFIASLVAYLVPASPWDRWHAPEWHPAIYNPPPNLNTAWWRRLFGFNSRQWGTGPDPPAPSAKSQPPASPFYTIDELSCAALPGAQDVMVVMRTAARETHSRLPVHLELTQRCIPNFDIYSDLEELVDGHPVHNAMDEIPSARFITYPEFELYSEQLDAKRRGRKDVAGLSHSKHLHHDQEDALSERLDRWKWLPMMDKVLTAKPTAKWFVFVETDTALLWSNLLQWLATLPQNEALYFGAQAYHDKLEYAHGGSGIVLSNSALRAIVHAFHSDVHNLGGIVSDSCCGDRVIGRTLREAGVSLTRARPLLQGEPPSALEYTAARWCSPVTSFHRMSSAAVRELWDFEQRWISAAETTTPSPILQRDLFKVFVAPSLRERRTEWDNLSEDRVLGRSESDEDDAPLSEAEVAALRSAHGCQHLCETLPECMQWRYRRDECAMGHSVRLGARQGKVAVRERATSGWIMERVATFVGEMDECRRPQWIVA